MESRLTSPSPVAPTALESRATFLQWQKAAGLQRADLHQGSSITTNNATSMSGMCPSQQFPPISPGGAGWWWGGLAQEEGPAVCPAAVDGEITCPSTLTPFHRQQPRLQKCEIPTQGLVAQSWSWNSKPQSLSFRKTSFLKEASQNLPTCLCYPTPTMPSLPPSLTPKCVVL